MMPGCGRTAHLGSLSIVNVSLSGIVQLGDHERYTPRLRAIAVQRQEDHLTAGEAAFASYPVFWRPFPAPPAPPVCGCPAPGVTLTKRQLCPDIRVGSVSIIGVGSSSMIQAGNGLSTHAESRIKHIRQFQTPLSTRPPTSNPHS